VPLFKTENTASEIVEPKLRDKTLAILRHCPVQWVHYRRTDIYSEMCS